MKILCAWCGTLVVAHCDHCGGKLLPAAQVGSFFDRDMFVCVNGETLLTFSAATVERMAAEHGFCTGCLDLPESEREKRILARPPRERPSAALRERFEAEIERCNQTARKRRVDHLPHEKKRGPTPTQNERDATREPIDAKQH